MHPFSVLKTRLSIWIIERQGELYYIVCRQLPQGNAPSQYSETQSLADYKSVTLAYSFAMRGG